MRSGHGKSVCKFDVRRLRPDVSANDEWRSFGATSESTCRLFNCHSIRLHEKLSFAVSIRLMNTSSRPDSIFSQRYAPVIHGADAGAQFLRVAPAHVQRRAERDDLLDAGQLADFFRQLGQIFAGLPSRSFRAKAGHFKRRQPGGLHDFVAPCRWRADFRRRCKPAGGSVPPRPCNAS